MHRDPHGHVRGWQTICIMRFMHDSPQLPVAGSHWHGCVVPYMRTRDTNLLRLIVW